MPIVQFKGPAKHAGKVYRQNDRIDVPEASAAALIAKHAAELVRGQKTSPGFDAMITTFREVEARKRQPASKEVQAKAAAERAEFERRGGGTVHHAARIY